MTASTPTPIRRNMRVRHRRFGEGAVTYVRTDGWVRVRFDDYKRLGALAIRCKDLEAIARPRSAPPDTTGV